ncbi:MAG: hypothetical protein HPZ91_00355 [Lentisphaeria bacterium]|nr:hypothetical protein [Lentisphaeria bacterium]
MKHGGPDIVQGGGIARQRIPDRLRHPDLCISRTRRKEGGGLGRKFTCRRQRKCRHYSR